MSDNTDELALLTWLKNNAINISPAAPAVAVTSAYIFPDDFVQFSKASPNKSAPHIQIWREPQFHEFVASDLSGATEEKWRVGLFIMFAYDVMDIWSIEGQSYSRMGYAYKAALRTWLKTNEKLDGNRVVGDGGTKYFIDPLTPAPPWAMCEGLGTYLSIPIQDLRT